MNTAPTREREMGSISYSGRTNIHMAGIGNVQAPPSRDKSEPDIARKAGGKPKPVSGRFAKKKRIHRGRYKIRPPAGKWAGDGQDLDPHHHDVSC